MSSGSSQGYREVAHRIRERIKQGVYPLGKQLPTEVELADELGVNRVTVNRALAILRAEGWIRTHRGVGTFVRDFMPIIWEAPGGPNSRETMRTHANQADGPYEQDLSYDTRIVTERIQPTPHIARLLRVSVDDVTVLAKTKYISIKGAPGGRTVPYRIAANYIPLAASGPAQDGGGIPASEAGHEDTIEVRPPEPDEAIFLQLNEDQRVFDITQLGFAIGGEVAEVFTLIIPTHMARLRYHRS
ncbi:GntR family transcriptional regulator [Nonomuraea endophytica]|uniref:GntR family transcriptional regulator n=1 Tax=Nonomuraea endophytica TaxID=714136 RepID=UPI0037C5236C